MDIMLKFKTNINCGGCLSSVKPVLDQADGICHWDIDLNDGDKILSVKSSGIKPQEVIQIIKETGFVAAEIN